MRLSSTLVLLLVRGLALVDLGRTRLRTTTIQFKNRSMSDPTLSDIDCKNKMALV